MMILPISNMNLSEEKARVSDPAVKTRLAMMMTSFRPILSFRIPPTIAKSAAPAMVTLTIISCQTELSRNRSRREIIAPEMTPVSYLTAKKGHHEFCILFGQCDGNKGVY